MNKGTLLLDTLAIHNHPFRFSFIQTLAAQQPESSRDVDRQRSTCLGPMVAERRGGIPINLIRCNILLIETHADHAKISSAIDVRMYIYSTSATCPFPTLLHHPQMAALEPELVVMSL